MKIKSAEFIKSAPSINEAPAGSLPEVALLGRSNVGKSSFINSICNRKKLAKTSNTPGKTRLLNYYLINDSFYIVDMPGYGYAKVPGAEQAKWQKNFEQYLLERDSLEFCIQFIDGRHSVQKNDLQMREWVDYHKIKTVTVITKLDCLKKSKVASSVALIKKTLGSDVINFSAKTGLGNSSIFELFQEFE